MELEAVKDMQHVIYYHKKSFEGIELYHYIRNAVRT